MGGKCRITANSAIVDDRFGEEKDSAWEESAGHAACAVCTACRLCEKRPGLNSSRIAANHACFLGKQTNLLGYPCDASHQWHDLYKPLQEKVLR
jgi:hypothetical protein